MLCVWWCDAGDGFVDVCGVGVCTDYDDVGVVAIVVAGDADSRCGGCAGIAGIYDRICGIDRIGVGGVGGVAICGGDCCVVMRVCYYVDVCVAGVIAIGVGVVICCFAMWCGVTGGIGCIIVDGGAGDHGVDSVARIGGDDVDSSCVGVGVVVECVVDGMLLWCYGVWSCLRRYCECWCCCCCYCCFACCLYLW